MQIGHDQINKLIRLICLSLMISFLGLINLNAQLEVYPKYDVGIAEQILESAFEDEKITSQHLRVFKKQLKLRSAINMYQRIDSMQLWGLDVLFIEEIYYPDNNAYIIREYYFSSDKSIKYNNLLNSDKHNFPRKYYENGIALNKYFLRHQKGQEHLNSIQNYMSNKSEIDKISAIIKRPVAHSGCGLSARLVSKVEKELQKRYKKPALPKYYEIETLIDRNTTKTSFQIPHKQKFELIIEGYSF